MKVSQKPKTSKNIHQQLVATCNTTTTTRNPDLFKILIWASLKAWKDPWELIMILIMYLELYRWIHTTSIWILKKGSLLIKKDTKPIILQRIRSLINLHLLLNLVMFMFKHHKEWCRCKCFSLSNLKQLSKHLLKKHYWKKKK